MQQFTAHSGYFLLTYDSCFEKVLLTAESLLLKHDWFCCLIYLHAEIEYTCACMCTIHVCAHTIVHAWSQSDSAIAYKQGTWVSSILMVASYWNNLAWYIAASKPRQCACMQASVGSDYIVVVKIYSTSQDRHEKLL